MLVACNHYVQICLSFIKIIQVHLNNSLVPTLVGTENQVLFPFCCIYKCEKLCQNGTKTMENDSMLLFYSGRINSNCFFFY